MADISILVDYSDVKEANKEILNMGTAAGQSAKAFEQAFRKAEAASRKNFNSVQANIRSESALRKQKERELAKEAALIDRLSQKYKPLYAASQLYEKSLNEINQAHKIGVLNTKQHELALGKLNAEYQDFGNGTANALNMFNQGLSRSNRGISHMSVLTQQAGYQVGDFIVQVQSGTNAFVAFGQQATQVAGTLTLLGGKWVAIGTALGIGIPLFTAVAAAVMRSGKEAKQTDTRFSDLSESISNLSTYTTDLVSTNEKAKESFSSLISVVREVEALALQKSLDNIMAPFEAKVREYETKFSNFRRFGGFGFEEPEFSGLGFDNIERAVQAYSLLRGIQGETKEELAESLRITELWLRGSGLLTDEVKQLLTEYAKAIDLQEAAVEKTSNANEKSLQGLQDQLRTLDQKNQLILAGNQFGKESLEYTKIKNEQELENLRISLEREAAVGGITEQENLLIDAILEAVSAQQEASSAAEILKAELGEAAVEALTLAGVDITSPISSAASAAAVLAGNLGIALNAAISLQNLRAAGGMKGAIYSGENRNVGRGSNGVVDQSYQQKLGYTSVEDLISQMTPRGRSGGRKGKKGGSSGGGSAQKDYVKALEEEIEKKRNLIGVFGEEKRVQEEVLALREKMKDTNKVLSQERLEGLVREKMKVEEILRQQEAIYKSFTTNIEDAMMSLVDGSKSIREAFGDMTRSIILDIYQQTVAKPFAKTAGNFLTNLIGGLFADGGAFSGGREIKAFANGGVVSGPTMFPMQGAMGLMGEAGPEAIMPLKRGANGKLGVEASNKNSAPVNVTFNISTPDVKGFQRSQSQIAGNMQRILQQGQRNG